jgi:hypothetical protein
VDNDGVKGTDFVLVAEKVVPAKQAQGVLVGAQGVGGASPSVNEKEQKAGEEQHHVRKQACMHARDDQ